MKIFIYILALFITPSLFIHASEATVEERIIEALQPKDIVGHAKKRIGSQSDGGYVVIDGFNYDNLYRL